MKKIKEKQTKIEKNYKKSRKNAQKRAVRHIKPETKKVSTHAAKTQPTKRRGRTILAKNTNPERRAPYTVVMEERFENISKAKRPTNNNLHQKAQNLTKNAQITQKTPRKRRTGQAQRQIKVINIRI